MTIRQRGYTFGLPNLKMKKCSKCKTEKSPEDFYEDRTRKDGLTCWCKACHAVANAERYRRDIEKSRAKGRARRKKQRLKNPEKEREASKKRYWNDPVKSRARSRKEVKAWRERGGHLKLKYGISLADFRTRLEEQNGCCLICDLKTNLVVDHCHKTGEVRGLLCRGCNTVLGFAKDSVYLLKKAAAYLGKFPKQNAEE